MCAATGQRTAPRFACHTRPMFEIRSQIRRIGTREMAILALFDKSVSGEPLGLVPVLAAEYIGAAKQWVGG